MHDNDGLFSEEFKQCPNCGANTWRNTSGPDFTWDEAQSELSNRRFEEYLQRREREDRRLLEQVEPFAFAQYLMDAAEEQIARNESEPA